MSDDKIKFDPQNAVALLETVEKTNRDIRDVLQLMRGTDSYADSGKYIVGSASAGATLELREDLNTEFPYIMVPAQPRVLSLFANESIYPFLIVPANTPVTYVYPRLRTLRILAAIGATAVPVIVEVSSREYKNPNTSISTLAGTSSSDLGKAEDSPHVSGDVGVMALGVRNQLKNVLAGADLDYSPIGVDSTGAVLANIVGGSFADGYGFVNAIRQINGSDAIVGVSSLIWNGTGLDKERSNNNLTILVSAVRTVTTDSSDIINYNGRGIDLWFDISAVPGVTTVTLSLQVKDPVSGLYTTIFTGAAEVGIATRHYRIYPGETVVANVAASIALPRTFRARVSHSGAGNFTYSVGGSIIL